MFIFAFSCSCTFPFLCGFFHEVPWLFILNYHVRVLMSHLEDRIEGRQLEAPLGGTEPLPPGMDPFTTENMIWSDEER